MITTDFSPVNNLFLAYPDGFQNEYEELVSFYDKLITKIPPEINLFVIVNNLKARERLKYKFPRKSIEIIIENTWNEIWLRDILGIVKDDYIIKPLYEPTYCNYLIANRNIRQLNNSAIKIAEDYIKMGVIQLPLKFDGGNFVANQNFAFITEKILSDNKLTQNEVVAIVNDALGVIPIIVPLNKGDILGHTDGYLSFLDDNIICITEYPKMEIFKDDNEYSNALGSICRDLNFRTITLYDRPLNYSIKCECELQKERNCCTYTANGNYINFLRLNNTIILPEYTLTTLKETVHYNNVNEEILSNLGYQVIKINCDTLAQHGGSLRCLSFTF
jgi:agmatine/peptidylarginine deiminase